MNNDIQNEYFRWMYDMVCGSKSRTSYRKLLSRLHSTEFYYMNGVGYDENRAHDGISLRYRFEQNTNLDSSVLTGPPSVLEVIVALAKRLEENIFDDPREGNRTSQWFWEMMTSLGLAGMTDRRYDQNEVDDVLEIFLRREYASNGEGGLFTVNDPDEDMRDVEIWTQAMWWATNKTEMED